MNGFPSIDRLYFENPSLRFAGLLASLVMMDEFHRLDFRPGTTVYSPSIVEHESVDALLAVLSQSHVNGTLYRGQTSRYEAIYSGRIQKLSSAVPDIDKVTVAFESLIPSMFRSVCVADGDWDDYEPLRILDHVANSFRAISSSKNDFFRNLLKEILQIEIPLLALRNGLARNADLKIDFDLGESIYAGTTNTPKRLMSLISISQHYDYRSAMVDFSASLEVAAWFATHEWNSGNILDDGQRGVVYRINSAALSSILAKEFSTKNFPDALKVRANCLYGVADISHLSSDYGKRPGAQFGASIFGLENSLLYFLSHLSTNDVFEIHTFPVMRGGYNSLDIDKADLVPEQDEVASLFSNKFIESRHSLENNEIAKFMKEEKLQPDVISDVLRFRDSGFV